MAKTKFKKNEIGMIPRSWEVKPLSQAIEINPKRTLKKGLKSKYVSMKDLKGHNKKIQHFVYRESISGSKFQNGDTVMARITPCLENGKIAFVDILEDGEICTGSTEFIVFSKKDRVSESNFVYYLSKSDQIRKIAIASMTGTSGRQRVQTELLGIKEVLLPPLPEQKAIAKILSDLDEKIEVNRQMNEILEELGQTLFKRWFVDFEFPNEKGKPYRSSGGRMVESELGEIPEGWDVGKLKQIIENFDSKRVPLSSREREKRKGTYPYYGATSIMDYVNEYIFDGVYLLMAEDGSVIDDSGFPILQYVWGRFWVNNHAHILQGKKEFSTEILHLLLLQINVANIVTGAVQLKISQKSMNSVPIIIPNKIILNEFNKLIQTMYNKIKLNKDSIKNTASIRDSLLPKLMTGKIRVKL